MSSAGTRNAYLPNYGVAVKVPTDWTDDQIDAYVHQNRAGISAISPVAQRNLANMNAQLPANQRATIDPTGSMQVRHQATIGAAPQQSLGDQALGALSSAGEALFSPLAKLGQMIKQGALATGLATPQAQSAYHKQMNATGPYQGAAAQDLAFSQLPQNFYEAVAPQQYHRATNLPYGAGGAVKFLSGLATPENIILGGVTGAASAADAIPGAVHTAMAGAFGVPLAAQGVGTLYRAETNPNPNLNDFVEGTLGTALGIGGLAQATEGLTGRRIGFPVKPTPATPAATTDATATGAPTSVDLGGVPLDYHAFQKQMDMIGGRPTVQAPPAAAPDVAPAEPMMTRAEWLAQMEQSARPDPNFTEPTVPVQSAPAPAPSAPEAPHAYPQSLVDAMVARMGTGEVVPSVNRDPAFYQQHFPGFDPANQAHSDAAINAYAEALRVSPSRVPVTEPVAASSPDPDAVAQTVANLKEVTRQAGNKIVIDGKVFKPTPEDVNEIANQFHANDGAAAAPIAANAEPGNAEGIATSGAANPQSAGGDFLTEANRILQQHGLQSVTPAEAAALGSAEAVPTAGRVAHAEPVAADAQPTPTAAENGAGADIRTADLGSAEAAAIRAGAGQATTATGEPGDAVSGGQSSAKSSTVPLKITAAEASELGAIHPQLQRDMDDLFKDAPKSVTISVNRALLEQMKLAAMQTQSNEVGYNKNSFYKRLQLASKTLGDSGIQDIGSGTAAPGSSAEYPGVDNRTRINMGQEPSRGKAALLSRLDMEMRRGGLDKDAGTVAQRFVQALPEGYLKGLASSFFKENTPRGVAGSYDSGKALIEIGKALSHTEPERVIPHEIAHHLQDFVDPADLARLNKEYQAQKRQYGAMSEAAKAAIADHAQQIDPQTGRANGVNDNQHQFLADTYRFKDFGEFFAESMADRALRDQFHDDLAVPAKQSMFERVIGHAKTLVQAAHDALFRGGDRQAADRIYQKLISGQYDADTATDRMGDIHDLPSMNPMDILNDPRTKEAIDRAKGFFLGDKPALTRESETTMAAVTQHEHSATTSQLEYNKHVAPIFKDFTRDEIQQFGAHATGDRMAAEGDRMDGVVTKAQSDLAKAKVDQKSNLTQFKASARALKVVDAIAAHGELNKATAKAEGLQKALDAATEQRQKIALGRQTDPHSWTDEQGNVHPVSPADIQPFFQQPKMAAALDAYKNTVEPLLARNQAQAGGSVGGIKGKSTGAFFPTQAVDDAGNSIGLSKMGGGGADSGGRSGPLAQLAVNNHDLAFAGTGKAYNNDFPQVLNDTMRKTLDVATERTMHQTAIKEGILADVNDATKVQRNPKTGQLEYNLNDRWEPATSLKLQGKYQFQNKGITDPTLPTNVAMPTRIYKEVAPLWERNSYHSELDDFSNKWWGRYMSTYLGHTLGDFVNHGGALSSRMAHAASRTLPGENSLDAARNVAAVIKSSERFVRYFNPDAFTPDQRFEAMHFAARSGVVPAEYPVSTPSDASAYSKATGWTKEKLYGDKGILTNAITDVYHQFKARGALNTIEGQAVLRDALRDLNTTGKTDQSTFSKITKTLGGGTFYQTGVKNRAAALNAGGVQFAAGLVGRSMAITTLVKSMDDKHRWPWEIPGYKWGDIPTGAHDTNGRPIYANMNLLDRTGMYADGITGVKTAVEGVAKGESLKHMAADYGVNLLNNAIAPAASGPLPAIASGITGMTPTLSLNRNMTGLEAIPNKSIHAGKITDLSSWPSRLSGALPMLGAMNDLGQTPGTNDVHGPARYINTAGRFFGLPQLHTGANEAIVRKMVQRQEAPVHAR